MDKTSQKVVTNDPKRQEQGKKSHETYMKRLKEKILDDNQLSTPSPMDRPTSSTPSSTRSTPSSTGDPTPSTSSHAARSNDQGILAVLAIGVCIFFVYKTSQAKNKKQDNKKQDLPLKRRDML